MSPTSISGSPSQSIPVSVSSDSPRSGQMLGGMFTRKERWGLSCRGFLVLALTVALVAVTLVLNVQPFLARTDRVGTNFLVVEGWVRQFAVHAADLEIKNGSYQKIFATGGPLVGTDGFTNDFNTAASVGANNLKNSGVPAQLIQMVPSHVAGRDRTYNSALALRNWIGRHHLIVHSLNVLTEDVHARRTQLLFQEAFGKDVAVGIISVPDPDYDAKHWWRYSEGVREVVGESIAYLYAVLLFHPGRETASGI